QPPSESPVWSLETPTCSWVWSSPPAEARAAALARPMGSVSRRLTAAVHAPARAASAIVSSWLKTVPNWMIPNSNIRTNGRARTNSTMAWPLAPPVRLFGIPVMGAWGSRRIDRDRLERDPRERGADPCGETREGEHATHCNEHEDQRVLDHALPVLLVAHGESRERDARDQRANVVLHVYLLWLTVVMSLRTMCDDCGAGIRPSAGKALVWVVPRSRYDRPGFNRLVAQLHKLLTAVRDAGRHVAHRRGKCRGARRCAVRGVGNGWTVGEAVDSAARGAHR